MSIDYSEKILFEEFEFHNKSLKLISETELSNLKNKVINKKSIYWTNKLLANNRLVINFYKDVNDVLLELLQFDSKVDMEFLDKVKDIHNGLPFSEKLNEIQQDIISRISKGERDENWSFFDSKIYTYEELFNENIENLNMDFDGIDYHDKIDKGETTKFLKYVKFILKEDEPDLKIKIIKKNSSQDLYYIFKVKELRINNKNYRIALTLKINDSDYNKHVNYYYIRCYSEDNEEYNYIDEDTMYIIGNDDKKYYFDRSMNIVDQFGIVHLKLENTGNLSRDLHKIIGNKRRIITENIYKFYRKMVVDEDKEKETPDKIQIIIDKYLEKIEDSKEIKIEQVKISKNKISTDDNMFYIEFDDNFIDLNKWLSYIREKILEDDARYNFNLIYEFILRNSVLKPFARRAEGRRKDQWSTEKNVDEIGDVKISVNGINIEIKKQEKFYVINNIRCRIEDVIPILNKAICYNNESDFNKYIKDVSYIGMVYKNMIASGVILDVQNTLFESLKFLKEGQVENIRVRFSLLWDTKYRNKVYLHLNNKRYLIKNKRGFRKYYNLPQKTVTVLELKNELEECLKDFKTEMMMEIIENGIKEAKLVKKRGLEFLNGTIKDINAKETQVNINDKECKGYIIIGVATEIKYFIDKESLDVFKFEEEKQAWNRRCVVDDPHKDRIYEDRLANRLVNIYNENPNISTL